MRGKKASYSVPPYSVSLELGGHIVNSSSGERERNEKKGRKTEAGGGG